MDIRTKHQLRKFGELLEGMQNELTDLRARIEALEGERDHGLSPEVRESDGSGPEVAPVPDKKPRGRPRTRGRDTVSPIQ